MIASAAGCLLLAGEAWFLLYAMDVTRLLRGYWRRVSVHWCQPPARPYTAADARIFPELEALLDPGRLVPEPVARNLGGETNG